MMVVHGVSGHVGGRTAANCCIEIRSWRSLHRKLARYITPTNMQLQSRLQGQSAYRSRRCSQPPKPRGVAAAAASGAP